MTDENRKKLWAKIFALKLQADNLTSLLEEHQIEPVVFLRVCAANREIQAALDILGKTVDDTSKV